MTRFVSAFFSFALICSAAAAAFADAQSDLTRAIAATEAVRSYHMTMTGRRMQFQGDVIPPSTMHVTMSGMEIINVNGKMYMRQGSAAWQMLAGGGGFTDSDVLQMMKTHRSDFHATDIGMKSVGGQTLHAYRVENSKTGKPETVYLDGSGRIVRVEAPSVTVQFSNFGAPVHIAAPI